MRNIGHFIGGKQVAGHLRPHRRRLPADDRRGASRAWRSPRKAELAPPSRTPQAAQPAWAATNPQRRARVMIKFLDLVDRDMDALADLLAREHGKTIADAKGDIQRGARGGRVLPAASRTC